jgi:hypothetical protein
LDAHSTIVVAPGGGGGGGGGDPAVVKLQMSPVLVRFAAVVETIFH